MSSEVRQANPGVSPGRLACCETPAGAVLGASETFHQAVRSEQRQRNTECSSDFRADRPPDSSGAGTIRLAAIGRSSTSGEAADRNSDAFRLRTARGLAAPSRTEPGRMEVISGRQSGTQGLRQESPYLTTGSFMTHRLRLRMRSEKVRLGEAAAVRLALVGAYGVSRRCFHESTELDTSRRRPVGAPGGRVFLTRYLRAI